MEGCNDYCTHQIQQTLWYYQQSDARLIGTPSITLIMKQTIGAIQNLSRFLDPSRFLDYKHTIKNFFIVIRYSICSPPNLKIKQGDKKSFISP